MVRAPSHVQSLGFQPRPLAGGGVFEDARVRKADIQRQETHRGMADLIWSSGPYIFTPGFYSAGGVQTTSKSPDGVRETFRRFPLTHSRPTGRWITCQIKKEILSSSPSMELQGLGHCTEPPPPQVTTRKNSLGHLTQRLRCNIG